MPQEPITVYRRSWCEDSDAAVSYFSMHNISYREIDIEKEGWAAKGVEFVTGGGLATPTLVYARQAIVVDPWDAGRFESWWQQANKKA